MGREKSFSEIGEHRLFYSACHHTVEFLGKTALGLKIEGVENVPSEGPALIAAKHNHWLDVLLIPVAVPDRHVSPLARASLFEHPALGKLFSWWDAIPLPREEFSSGGRETWREVEKRLSAGRLVPIFPEGTRTPGRVGELKEGVARFAFRAQVPTIPVAARGANSLTEVLKRKATVAFGEAIDPPTDRSDEAQQIYLQKLSHTIEKLYEG